MKAKLTLSAMAVLVLLAVSAYAATYDWSYEGNVVPTGAYIYGSGGVLPAVSSDGDIMTIDFASDGEPGFWDVQAWYLGSSTSFNNTADTWTVDFRMARPVGSGGWANTPDHPGRVVLGVVGSGTGGQLTLTLGRDGYGGLGGGDPAYDDSSTLTLNTTETGNVEIVVPGLNVGVMNAYRIVGTGGGSYKVYVNNIATAAYTGTLTQNYSWAELTYGAQFAPANSQSDLKVLFDYIRANNSVAYNSEPVKAGIEGQIQLLDFHGDLSLAPVRVTLSQSGVKVAGKNVELTSNPGSYAFPELTPGAYSVTFEANKFLTKIVAEVQVTNGIISPVNASLINGDVGGNNEVANTDASVVLQNLDQKGDQ